MYHCPYAQVGIFLSIRDSKMEGVPTEILGRATLSWLTLNSIQTNPEHNKRKNSNKKKHLGKIHVFLITICLHWNHHVVNWGEWGACSVTCVAGQRSREGCGKRLKPGQTCPPPGRVESETEECSIVPCTGKLSIMASMIRNYHCLVRELSKKGYLSRVRPVVRGRYREFPFCSDSLVFVEKVKHQFSCFALEIIFLLNVSKTKMSSVFLLGKTRRGYR